MDASRTSSWLPLGLLGAWLAITMGWWALAFTAITPATPFWLARAQSVCFGTLANGLPDTYGWMKLIVPPLVLLSMLTVVHGAAWPPALAGLWRRAAGKAVFAAVLALLLVQGGWVVSRVQAGLAIDTARTVLPVAREPLPEHYPRRNLPAPPIALVDQHGASFSLERLRGEVVLLTFAFGHCTATCPLTVRSMVLAAQQETEHALRPVIVTLDPWRDTPGALKGIARKWELPEAGRMLTGPVSAVLDVLRRYEMVWERDERTGDIAHPPLVYVIDPAGRIAYLLNNPPPAWIAEAGRRAAVPN